MEQWNQWQKLLWNDDSLGEKLISQIVTKSKKDVKRFNIFFGSGKNASTVKLEASSPQERDLWVLAIQ